MDQREMDPRNRNVERRERGSRGGSFLSGLMIGGLMGAGAMLLLAPQAGRQTREELQQGALELRDRATDTVRQTADQVRSRASQLQEQGRDIAIDQLDRVSSAAQSRKKALQESKNQQQS